MDAVHPGFHITSSRCGDELVISLAGEIDVAACPHIVEFVEIEVPVCPGVLVVDLAAVTFVDSTGLALLVQAQDRVARRGGRVVVRNPNDQFRRLLAITGVDALVTIEPAAPVAGPARPQAGVVAGAMARPLTSLPPW